VTALPHLRAEVARQLADDDVPPVTWRTPSRVPGVEVAAAPYGGVWMRNAGRRWQALDLTPADWAALVASVRAGEAGAA
jgi:hypothetical protein